MLFNQKTKIKTLIIIISNYLTELHWLINLLAYNNRNRYRIVIKYKIKNLSPLVTDNEL